MVTFLHAADLHLDSPLRGLTKYPGAPVDAIRQASRQALVNLVDLAIDQQVDFVLIAGDLYDRDWQDYSTGLWFVGQLLRLKEALIPVFLIAGNHDAINKMSRKLRLPDNVCMFSHEQAQTRVLDDLGVAVHGQSFATQAVMEDLSRGYPEPIAGMVNVAMLHTSATGREGHENYAPCTIEGLREKGYDYWALGHVHAHEVLATDPPIVFSGTIQGRHIREMGPKGCCLCTIDTQGRVESTFRALDVFRWDRAVVDISPAETMDDVLMQVSQRLVESEQPAEGRPLGVRVELTGRTPLHRELSADRHKWTHEVYSQALDLGRDRLWVEKVEFHTSPERDRRHSDGAGDDPLSELSELMAEMRSTPGALDTWGIRLEDVLSKLPADLRQALPVNDDRWWAGVIDEAESRLAAQLGGKGAL